MLSFPSKAWFDEECKAHLKLFKLTKVTKQKGLNVVQILNNGVWRGTIVNYKRGRYINV